MTDHRLPTVEEITAEASRRLDEYLAAEGVITIRRPPLPPPHDGKGYTLRTTPVREMTAGDLGLRDSRSSGCDYWDRLYGYLSAPTSDLAPYSFWLGSEGVGT